MSNWANRLIAMGIDPDAIESGDSIDLTEDRPPRVAVQRGRRHGKNTAVAMKSSVDTELEEVFLDYWNLYGATHFEIVTQYYFNPGTKWRCDFAFPGQEVLVEIDGAVGKGGVGGHRNWHGFLRDKEHDFWAACNGWQMVRIPSPWLWRDSEYFRAKVIIEGLNGILNERN